MARRSGLADRVGAILNANINRQQVHGRARLIVMIAIVAVLVPLSAIHLLERSANVARAANAATTAAAPTNSDEHCHHCRIGCLAITCQSRSFRHKAYRCGLTQ